MIAALALLLLPAGDPDLAAAIARELPRVTETRRRIHAHPELGEREVETARLVASRLRELGLEVREGVAKTGVLGVLAYSLLL